MCLLFLNLLLDLSFHMAYLHKESFLLKSKYLFKKAAKNLKKSTKDLFLGKIHVLLRGA